MHRNETERAELKLRAEQAKMLADDMSAFEEGSDAPRTRLLDMAKKLESAKLLELRHKRELELEKEQLAELWPARIRNWRGGQELDERRLAQSGTAAMRLNWSSTRSSWTRSCSSLRKR